MRWLLSFFLISTRKYTFSFLISYLIISYTLFWSHSSLPQLFPNPHPFPTHPTLCVWLFHGAWTTYLRPHSQSLQGTYSYQKTEDKNLYRELIRHTTEVHSVVKLLCPFSPSPTNQTAPLYVFVNFRLSCGVFLS